MSIQINTIRISNFRGISNIEMSLPRVTVLLGPNNTGKTSIIKALQLSLGDYSRFISDEDFYINEIGEKQGQITVDVRIVPINDTQIAKEFSTNWLQEFGDKIQSEADGQQFLAIRTIVKQDIIKGGFNVERYTLNQWSEFASWLNTPIPTRNKLAKRLDALPFFPIEAQRDIHSELKEKGSFIGKALSSINYNGADITVLEELISELNSEAIEKSESLKELKVHLDQLNQSLNSSGNTELTPFPKKVRDLSKGFSIHFGESNNSSFSMEYHGMGTRSWASILTLKAFISLQKKNHEEEVEPFFPIIAAEEPEAHLHPSAQRTLYNQLVDNPGQVIISTHSPYIIGTAKLHELRGLFKKDNLIISTQISSELNPEDLNILNREIMRLRGELLFSKAIILFEGVTEEQIIPSMFYRYFEKHCFSVGISCISVAGKNYPPFIKMAHCFNIPVFILSDNDGETQSEINAQIGKIKAIPNLFKEDLFHISFLSNSNDIEAELVDLASIHEELISSLIKSETKGSKNQRYIDAKKAEIESLNRTDLLQRLRDSKASYAGFLANEILCSEKDKHLLIPNSVKTIFEKIQEVL